MFVCACDSVCVTCLTLSSPMNNLASTTTIQMTIISTWTLYLFTNRFCTIQLELSYPSNDLEQPSRTPCHTLPRLPLLSCDVCVSVFALLYSSSSPGPSCPPPLFWGKNIFLSPCTLVNSFLLDLIFFSPSLSPSLSN